MRDYATEGLDLALHIRRRVLGQESGLDVSAFEALCFRQAQVAARGTKGGAVDRESELQALLVAALRADPLWWPIPSREASWGVVSVHHSPMGGGRSEREGAELKRNGARAGWPDLDLRIVDRGGTRRSVLLELKAPGGRVSRAQRDAHRRLRDGGFEVRVVVGLQEMADEVVHILSGKISEVGRAAQSLPYESA